MAKVLLVEDDPWMRDVLRELLADEGHTVICAPSGEDGLQMAREIIPRIITLDVVMSGLSGWDVLSRLRAEPRLASIPVIMLTVMDNRNHGFLLGAAEYLSKPVDRNRLVEVLTRFRRHGNPGSALVIEDDFHARRILSTALRGEGLKVD